MRIIALTIITWLALYGTQVAAGELVIIVNLNSGVESMSQRDVINIYMGRYQRLPSNISAVPIDLPGKKESFYQLLTRRTLAEINSYWARLVFSGRGSPPLQVETVEQVISMVANNPGAIAYIPAEFADERVRVALRLAE